MYLAGFALTLVFVIARLVELMHEGFNAHDEKEQLEKKIKEIETAAARNQSLTTDISPNSDETESTLRKRANIVANEDKLD